MMDSRVTRHGTAALLYIGALISTVTNQLIGSYPKVEIGPYKPWPPPYPPYQDVHAALPPPYPPYQDGHVALPPPYPLYQEILHHPTTPYHLHPGYQTDIIINPYNQNDGIVRITTKDVSTGLEIGNTEWSGPGTLTLSTLAASSSLHDAVGKADADYEFVSVPIQASHAPRPPSLVPASARPRPPSHMPASARPRPPHGAHPHHAGHEPLYPGQAVLGSVCQGLYDCNAILNGVCGFNSYCRGVGCAQHTCQCPKGHTPIYNSLSYTPRKTPSYTPRKTPSYTPRKTPSYTLRKTPFYTHGKTPSYIHGKRPPKRRKRSLRYYQECQKDI